MKAKTLNGRKPNGRDPNQPELFAIVWLPPEHRFRLRVNDLLRVDGRMARVIRVTESAAAILVNQPVRNFKTRFDKPVQFQPPPKITRMSANAECEILNWAAGGRGKSKHKERRNAWDSIIISST
ncbi:MAG: hypothetical protein KGL39_33260 [Patescibacteria group bacterium]|nr:hypothetical protein [Patescibacteria group bacterium]